MPHVIIEYTDNLREDGNIPRMLQSVNDALLAHDDVIPIGGLRTRAIELKDYVVADGTEDDAFVHVTLKLGGGRSEEAIKRIGDALFEAVQNHFKNIYEKRYLALSMEIVEFTRPTYKQNNIHLRYKK